MAANENRFMSRGRMHRASTGLPTSFWLLAVVVVLVVDGRLHHHHHHNHHGCSFPQYVQARRTTADRRSEPETVTSSSSTSATPRRRWLTHVTEKAAPEVGQCAERVTFVGGTMRVDDDGRCTASDDSRAAAAGVHRPRWTSAAATHPSHAGITECLLEAGPSRYLTRRRAASTTGSGTGSGGDGESPWEYGCIEFIRRSSDVVQLRRSTVGSRTKNASLCSDEGRMALDDWPLVDEDEFLDDDVEDDDDGRRSTFERRCAIRPGGYAANIYDKLTRQGVCDAYDSETRIEAGCVRGEGLVFRFRYAACVPQRLNMRIDQPARCLASWTDGRRYAYTVLRHDAALHFWCLRRPIASTSSRSAEAFAIQLFRDLVCGGDVGDQGRSRAGGSVGGGGSGNGGSGSGSGSGGGSNRFLTIAMTPEPARATWDSLCVDDYEACRYWSRPCAHVGSVAMLTCARSCGICSAGAPPTPPRPTGCSLPAKLRGRWREVNTAAAAAAAAGSTTSYVGSDESDKDGFRSTSQQWRRTIDIGRSSFHLGANATTTTSEAMMCVQWDEPVFEPEARSAELMFVQMFANGCRPRYSCAHFRLQSAAVLRLRISRPRIWPFLGTTGVSIDCAGLFEYADHRSGVWETSTTKHFNVFVSDAASSDGDAGGVGGVGGGSSSAKVHVKCRLPVNRTTSALRVRFQNGLSCPGRIAAATSGGWLLNVEEAGSLSGDAGFAATATGFKLILSGCPTGHDSEQEYRCLDSSTPGFAGDLTVLTETLPTGDDSSVVCWLFPVYPQGVFYLLSAVGCYEDAREKIARGRLLPLATFTIVAPSTTATSSIRATTTTSISFASSTFGYSDGAAGGEVGEPEVRSMNLGRRPGDDESVHHRYDFAIYNEDGGRRRDADNDDDDVVSIVGHRTPPPETDETRQRKIIDDDMAKDYVADGSNQTGSDVIFISSTIAALYNMLCFVYM